LSPDGSPVKCDVEAVNAVGQTPLLVACEAGQDEAALALARRGANLGVEDSEGANVATLAPKLVSALRAIKQGDAYL
jgi:ankyrin repeat protein